MGVKHLALGVLVVVSLVMPATQVIAIELGELQAMPGSPPPYIFRLSLIFPPHGSSDLPAVTVRQPRDGLSFVKNHRLELRLPALTDVELEINQGGQTLNRLLLKSELQAARARLETATASIRHQPARATGRQGPATEARPLTSTAEEAPDQALLAREMQEIRQEIQNLVGRVTPWEGLSTPVWPAAKAAATPVVARTLWGVLIAGVASLVAGYLLRRNAVERQRRRLLAASVRRLRGQLRSGGATRHPAQRAQLFGDQPAGLGPVTVLRRVRVSQKTRRRIRLWASSPRPDATRERAAERTQVEARLSHTRRFAPAEVVEALGHLRRELLSLQRRLPNRTSPESSRAGSKRATR
jgi:hypothetical protein